MAADTAHTDPLTASAMRLRRWCVDAALPLWTARAQRADGSWVEHLNLDGSPDETAERRWRVVARQAVSYALATSANWYDGTDVAVRSFAAYWDQGFVNGAVVHRIAADGSVSDPRPDLYDHAFGLLACARMYGLTRRADYLRRADLLLSWVQAQQHVSGGFGEGAVKPNPRRQNPHMHLLEASLALYDVSADDTYLQVAHEVIDLFRAYFFDAGRIREFFTQDWSRHPEAGDVIEPGHAAEWIWLLSEYDKASGRDHGEFRAALYAATFSHRLNRLFDEEDASGEIKRQTTRLWVQTEAIKAHLAMAETGTPGARGMAAASIDALWGRFLLTEGRSNGLWADQLNACHANVATTIPVSTMYHIILMAVEAERVAALN